MKLIKVVPLLALATGVAAGQPSISSVSNAASYLVQGLPNSGIAQGAIFVVYGTDLGPSTPTTAPNPFQSTNLDQTSISVTVGNTTVNALMYYAFAGQLTALLPSNTPIGSGSMIVNYQGSPSASFAVSVVQNNVGVFTIPQNGQGVAIATYPDYSLVSAIPGTGSLADTCTTASQACPYTYTGAAHTGDVLTLWATGLGAVSGGDSAASLGQQITVPLTLWIGGVSVPVSYQGRSGCCIGEDQIQFTMPSTVPTGCTVPVLLQIGTLVSNSTVLPIASSGRSCTPQNPALTSSVVQALTTGTAPITLASFELGRQILGVNSSGVFYDDYGGASFGQYSLSYGTQATQPVVLSSIDNPPFGTCIAFPVGTNANPNGLSGNPLLVTALAGADPGSITVTGPEGQLPLTDRGGTPTSYSAVLSQFGTYFSVGTYTIAGSGGTGTNPIGRFTTNFTIMSPAPTWGGSDQNRLITAGVTRANGFTINWTPGSAAANYNVVIGGSSYTDDTGTTGAAFSCLAPSTLGTFTVPPSVLLALPAAPTRKSTSNQCCRRKALPRAGWMWGY